MKVRTMVDQKKEIIFYAIGTLMVIAIVVYLFTLIRVLSGKVTKVFAPPRLSSEGVIRYNFEEYEKLFPGTIVSPTSTPSNSTSSSR